MSKPRTTFCECGCGSVIVQKIGPGRKRHWIDGHRPIGVAPVTQAANVRPRTKCACGCGVWITQKGAGRNRTYCSGHNLKVNTRYCKCGCGREVPKSKQYIQEHKPVPLTKKLYTCACGCGQPGERFGASKSYAAGHRPKRYCKCGCGGAVSTRRTYGKYIPGHNPNQIRCKHLLKTLCDCDSRKKAKDALNSKRYREKNHNNPAYLARRREHRRRAMRQDVRPLDIIRQKREERAQLQLLQRVWKNITRWLSCLTWGIRDVDRYHINSGKRPGVIRAYGSVSRWSRLCRAWKNVTSWTECLAWTVTREPDPEASGRWLIYALIDPVTLLVRYIGQSTKGMIRPRVHRHEHFYNNYKSNWIKGLKRKGLTFNIAILEIAPEGDLTRLNELEAWWILYGRLSVWPLTNMTDGGDGVPGRKLSEETKQKISLKRRSRK